MSRAENGDSPGSDEHRGVEKIHEHRDELGALADSDNAAAWVAGVLIACFDRFYLNQMRSPS